MSLMALALALAAQAGVPAIDPAVTPTKPLAAPRATAPSQSQCDEPVLLVISGPTDGIETYRRATYASGLYQQLGGYELNSAQASNQLAGDATRAQVIMRFPCHANAMLFWTSKVQQGQLAQLQGASAVLYSQLPLREDLVGKVGDDSYAANFDPPPGLGTR